MEGSQLMNHTCGLILAAGDGKRMRSNSSKVLCQVLFEPMLRWVMDNCAGAGVGELCVVVGKGAEDVRAALPEGTATVEQRERLGTGHAVRCGADFIREHLGEDLLILFGDAPFLFPQVIQKAYTQHKEQGNAMTVISAVVEDPFGYGRILRGDNGLEAIVEERDADDVQRRIREINAPVAHRRA